MTAPEPLPAWQAPVLPPFAAALQADIQRRAAKRFAMLAKRWHPAAPMLTQFRALTEHAAKTLGVAPHRVLASLVRFEGGAALPSYGSLSSRLGALAETVVRAELLAAACAALGSDPAAPGLRTRTGWARSPEQVWRAPRARGEYSPSARLRAALGSLARLLPSGPRSLAAQALSGGWWEVSDELGALLAPALLPPTDGGWYWDPNRGDPQWYPRWAGEELPEVAPLPADSQAWHAALQQQYGLPLARGAAWAPAPELTLAEHRALTEVFEPPFLGSRCWAEVEPGNRVEFQVVSVQQHKALRARDAAERAAREELLAAAIARGELGAKLKVWELRGSQDPAAREVLRLARAQALAATSPQDQPLLDLEAFARDADVAVPPLDEPRCYPTGAVAELPGERLASELWGRYQARLLGASSFKRSERLLSRGVPDLARALWQARRPPERGDAAWLAMNLLRATPRALSYAVLDAGARALILHYDARRGLMTSAWATHPLLSRLAPLRDAEARATRARIEGLRAGRV